VTASIVGGRCSTRISVSWQLHAPSTTRRCARYVLRRLMVDRTTISAVAAELGVSWRLDHRRGHRRRERRLVRSGRGPGLVGGLFSLRRAAVHPGHVRCSRRSHRHRRRALPRPPGQALDNQLEDDAAEPKSLASPSQAAAAASIGPGPAPAYIRAELTSGGNIPKSTVEILGSSPPPPRWRPQWPRTNPRWSPESSQTSRESPPP